MKKVLIIDDDPVIGRVLMTPLRARQHRVIMAHDPVQGIRLALTERPDLILLDWKMPAGGGQIVLDALRKNGFTAMIPVMIITALDAPELDSIQQNGSVVAFVRKPFDPSQVLRQILTILGEPDAAGSTSTPTGTSQSS